MRIFKHKYFHRWAESVGLSDKRLKDAIDEMEKGMHDGSLGSGLYKKRVASQGKGKSGGYRTLIAFKNEDKAFFVYGFAKNVRSNIDEKEEKIYRQLAKDYLGMSDKSIDVMIKAKSLYEVK